MKIILATRNPSKILQIKPFFMDGITIQTQVEAGVEGEAVEDGGSLELNARKKVQYVQGRVPGSWVMADDTGLFIDALQGEPGVEAAYWGGGALSTEERMAYCLQRLSDVTNRSATFRTVAVVLTPEGEEHTFTGEVRGSLLKKPRVAPQPKMPYSALFVPEGQIRSWAEMTTEEENVISHRGKAFRKVRAFLQESAA